MARKTSGPIKTRVVKIKTGTRSYTKSASGKWNLTGWSGSQPRKPRKK